MFDPTFGVNQDPFVQQEFAGPLSSPAQYVSPYEAMLGLPPGSGQIANVLGPIMVEHQRAEARAASERARRQCQPQACHEMDGPAEPLTRADLAGCLQGVGVLAVLGVVVVGLLYLAGMVIGGG